MADQRKEGYWWVRVDMDYLYEDGSEPAWHVVWVNSDGEVCLAGDDLAYDACIVLEWGKFPGREPGGE